MQSIESIRPGSKINIAIWGLQIFVALIFLLAGGAKLLGAERMVDVFSEIGLGQWFRFLTGSIELVSAGLVLWPGLAAFGALTLCVTMIGAVFTHLLVIGGSALPATILFLLAATVGWARRSQLAFDQSRVHR